MNCLYSSRGRFLLAYMLGYPLYTTVREISQTMIRIGTQIRGSALNAGVVDSIYAGSVS